MKGLFAICSSGRGRIQYGWFVGALIMLATARVTAQPVNNLCGSALALADGDTPISTVMATTDGATHLACEFPNTGNQQIFNDIWFNYIASCTGNVTLSTEFNSFDTRVAVYTGVACPATTAMLIGCDDNSGVNDASRMEFPAFAGAQYKIRVGGAIFGATGGSILRIECVPWQSHVYKDADGDGTFEHIASYAVDPDVALAAYAASPDSQFGSGAVFAYNTSGPTQSMGFGSNLESFMSVHYPPAPGGSPACPRCDLEAEVSDWDFGCPQISCTRNLCEGYANARRPAIFCNGDTQCPPSKKCLACDATVFYTTNINPCFCDPLPGGGLGCKPQPDVAVHIAISRLPLCTCVEPKPIKVLLKDSRFTDCPFPVPPGQQTEGDGPVTRGAFQAMVPWGSNGYKYGGCHKNNSNCKITSIKMTLTSPCDTFDTTSNGDGAFPMKTISPDGKSIEFFGGCINPGETFYSRVPVSEGSYPAPGNPDKPRGTYLGQACPGKPGKIPAPAIPHPNSPWGGNDWLNPDRAPRATYDEEFQVIRFDFKFVSFVRYADGTKIRENNEEETIIDASIFVRPMHVIGPIESFPGAFRLSDSMIDIVSGPLTFLSGGLVEAIIYPDNTANGLGSVIQANIVWPLMGEPSNTRFMDEFLFPPEPDPTHTIFFQSDLLGVTNNFTTSGVAQGQVTLKNTFPLPSEIPAMSNVGRIIAAGLLVGFGIMIARNRQRRAAIIPHGMTETGTR